MPNHSLLLVLLSNQASIFLVRFLALVKTVRFPHRDFHNLFDRTMALTSGVENAGDLTAAKVRAGGVNFIGRGGTIVDAVGPEPMKVPDPRLAFLVGVFIVVVVLAGLAEAMTIKPGADVEKLDVWVVHGRHDIAVGRVDLFDQVVDVFSKDHCEFGPMQAWAKRLVVAIGRVVIDVEEVRVPCQKDFEAGEIFDTGIIDYLDCLGLHIRCELTAGDEILGIGD